MLSLATVGSAAEHPHPAVLVRAGQMEVDQTRHAIQVVDLVLVVAEIRREVEDPSLVVHQRRFHYPVAMVAPQRAVDRGVQLLGQTGTGYCRPVVGALIHLHSAAVVANQSLVVGLGSVLAVEEEAYCHLVVHLKPTEVQPRRYLVLYLTIRWPTTTASIRSWQRGYR